MSDQAQITVLKFPDNVRLRKEMYLIDPNHCIYEIVDNAVDEYAAGRCKNITVKVSEYDDEETKIIVSDDGGGIPTSPSKDPDHKGKCQAEVALGTLSSSGKYGTEDGYKTATSGLHGVGASCVNAVSKLFTAQILHNKMVTNLHYEKGILKHKEVNCPTDSNEHGTSITFMLDRDLWKSEQYNFDIVRRRLQQLTYLNPGLTIKWVKEKNNVLVEDVTNYNENGLQAYYQNLTSAKLMLVNEPIIVNKTVKNDEVGDIQINVAFGYSQGYTGESYSFVNNVTTQSGDHVVGFNTGVVKAIQNYLSANDKYKNLNKNLTSDDCKEGLVTLISVKVMAPKFEGQSKSSIKMPEVRSAMYNTVLEEMKLYLDQHPQFVKALTEKLEKAAKARIAAKRARESIRNAKNTLAADAPAKLAACSSKKPAECEIYLVEGDSAAGSAVQGRDSRIQAILPVFGKILNSEKSREDEVITNSKLLEVIKALRCGIGKSFDIDKLRYDKIIIMADADVDGRHIATLWITFFYRYMPEIVKNGHLYIAVSPLYRITEKVGKKENYHYFYSDEELEEFKNNCKNTFYLDYIKGLGELQPQQLWESTMDPENRRIIQIVEGETENDSRAIEVCMGDNVDIRRQFILTNANFEKVV